MKKLLIVALFAFSSCAPAYVRHAHQTNRRNPVFAKYDTVRVYTLFAYNDFEIDTTAARGCYGAWDLKTREYVPALAGANLVKISK